MAGNHLHEVLGRAIVDEKFRKNLFKDAKTACEAEGLGLEAHQYAQIKSIDRAAFEQAAGDLAGGEGAAG